MQQEGSSLSVSNKKIEMKEKLLRNVHIISSKKDRLALMKNAFITWRCSWNSSKGQNLAIKLAKRHYRNILLKSIVHSWRLVVGISWKTKVERSIHRDADFRIAVAAKETDNQIKLLQQKISLLEKQLIHAHSLQKEKQNEIMNKLLLNNEISQIMDNNVENTND